MRRSRLQQRLLLLQLLLLTPPPPTTLPLQEGTRLLIQQLGSLPSHKRSVAELRAAGEYADLGAIWLHIDDMAASIDLGDHSPANARRVHDAFMLHLCFRERPIARPSCIRLLKVPGAFFEQCSECSDPSCLGNGWQGNTIVMRHYKTSGAYGDYTIEVAPGSKTALFMEAYLDWGRPLLLQEETNALFLNTRGKAFRDASAFNKYMPRLLQGVAKLTWTRVRPCRALRRRALPPPLSSRHAPSPTAAPHHGQRPRAPGDARPARGPRSLHANKVSIGAARRRRRRAVALLLTIAPPHALASHSVSMLQTVYQDNRREFVTQLGMDLYTSLHPAAADPATLVWHEEEGDGAAAPAAAAAAAHAPEEADEAGEFVAPSQQQLQEQQSPALVQQQQQQLLAPVSAQQRRMERAPVAHLVSLVAGKRKAGAFARSCVLH